MKISTLATPFGAWVVKILSVGRVRGTTGPTLPGLISIMFGFALLLGACSPQRVAYRKIKRNMAKVEAAIKAYPELADSLKLTRNEPITAPEFTGDLEVTPELDSALVDSLAIELAKANYLLSSNIKARMMGDYQKALPTVSGIRKTLVKAARPNVKTDTTFYLTVIDGTDSLKMPIHVSLEAAEGKLKSTTSLQAIRWDRQREKNQIAVTCPETPFYLISWFWAMVAFAGLFTWSVLRK